MVQVEILNSERGGPVFGPKGSVDSKHKVEEANDLIECRLIWSAGTHDSGPHPGPQKKGGENFQRTEFRSAIFER